MEYIRRSGGAPTGEGASLAPTVVAIAGLPGVCVARAVEAGAAVTVGVSGVDVDDNGPRRAPTGRRDHEASLSLPKPFRFVARHHL